MKKKVAIITLGGTIQGESKNNKSIGYKSGAVDFSKILANLSNRCDFEVTNICSINSDDITMEIYKDLVKVINIKIQDKAIDSIIITHGTDVVEETCILLKMLINTKLKPIVVTGAMKPYTSFGYDGIKNLEDAISVSIDESSKNQDLLFVFDSKIYDAKTIEKCDFISYNAFSGNILGYVLDDLVTYKSKCNNIDLDCDFSTFCSSKRKMPKINIIYFHACATTDLLDFALKNSDGLVVVGAGSAELSQIYLDRIKNSKIPIVICSRVKEKIVTKNHIKNANLIPSNQLNAQKSAMVLRLCLLFNLEKDKIAKIFSKL